MSNRLPLKYIKAFKSTQKYDDLFSKTIFSIYSICLDDQDERGAVHCVNV